MAFGARRPRRRLASRRSKSVVCVLLLLLLFDFVFFSSSVWMNRLFRWLDCGAKNADPDRQDEPQVEPTAGRFRRQPQPIGRRRPRQTRIGNDYRVFFSSSALRIAFRCDKILWSSLCFGHVCLACRHTFPKVDKSFFFFFFVAVEPIFLLTLNGSKFHYWPLDGGTATATSFPANQIHFQALSTGFDQVTEFFF